MKAIKLGQPASLESLYLDKSPESKAPEKDEIKVHIYAAALNFRDALVVNGFFPAENDLIPLSDAAGEVVEIGENVSDFKVGDKVVSTFHPNWFAGHMERAQLNCSPGGPAQGYACEYATRPCNHFTLAPASLNFAEAATLTCAGVTAWRAVVCDARVKPGDTVLVQGTGGVSLFALQFAKACGATVIATSSSESKLQRLQELGADYVINHQTTENWGEVAVEMSGGTGVDVVVEVGGPNTMAQSFAASRTGAHIAIIGAVAGFDIDTIPFAVIQAKRLRLQGVTLGTREDQINMVKAIDAHTIKPVVDSHFSLDCLGEAFERLNKGEHFGKIVIDI